MADEAVLRIKIEEEAGGSPTTRPPAGASPAGPAGAAPAAPPQNVPIAPSAGTGHTPPLGVTATGMARAMQASMGGGMFSMGAMGVPFSSVSGSQYQSARGVTATGGGVPGSAATLNPQAVQSTPSPVGIDLASLGAAATFAAGALARFSADFLNPNPSPAVFVAGLGRSVDDAAATIGIFSPMLGKLVGVVGDTIGVFARLMENLDGWVRRLAPFSPMLAQAEAQANVIQLYGDIRRAQQVGPALSQYLQARTQLQQKIEDTKVRLLEQVTPLIIRGMQAVETALPFIELAARSTADTLKLADYINSNVLGDILRRLGIIADKDKQTPVENAWEVIKNSAQFLYGRGNKSQPFVGEPGATGGI